MLGVRDHAEAIPGAPERIVQLNGALKRAFGGSETARGVCGDEAVAEYVGLFPHATYRMIEGAVHEQWWD
ncbi:hypothetical protein [Candidatus Viadribacter manganicus]|uniref:hypothetical protein n=1 Tax=Candidatus Viadribacter manganicus TaxID=1759059 RepID=UPI0009F2B56E|nr:hypothetical protein [Candidatus Viadribacter manganicus]